MGDVPDDDAGALIPQPHGGALRKPWDRNASKGASLRATSLRATRREAMALLAEATPKAIERLTMGLDSPDERVGIISAEQVLNRVLGRPSDTPQGDDVRDVHDLSGLTSEQRAEVRQLAARLRQLLALAASARGSMVVEHEGEAG
jgi:hypothetical protein